MARKPATDKDLTYSDVAYGKALIHSSSFKISTPFQPCRNQADAIDQLVRGVEATLKRILQEPARTMLYPENSTMEAMEFRPEEVQVQGVLVGQMRSYRKP